MQDSILGLQDQGDEDGGAYPILPQGMDTPNEDFFKFRIDNTQILEELEHQLKGEVFVNGHWEKKFNQELSDEGVMDIINIVYTFGLNKSNILGCLTHDEIYDRCRNIWHELAKYIFLNGYKIGVDRTKRSILIRKVVYMIHSALSRSELGREAGQLSTAHQRVEHYMKQETPKRSNPLNPFEMFKK